MPDSGIYSLLIQDVLVSDPLEMQVLLESLAILIPVDNEYSCSIQCSTGKFFHVFLYINSNRERGIA